MDVVGRKVENFRNYLAKPMFVASTARMFRFIHAADLHLDAPLHSFALKDEVLSDLVGSATRGALERIETLCLEEDVHALLIAGDLYDRDLHSMKTAAFLTAHLGCQNDAAITVRKNVAASRIRVN
jgi:hypothetical protein